MLKKFKHNVIKEICMRFNIDIVLVVVGYANRYSKPFTLIYIPSDQEQEFLSAFYSNSGLTELYQLINYKRMSDYDKFLEDVNNYKGLTTILI